MTNNINHKPIKKIIKIIYQVTNINLKKFNNLMKIFKKVTIKINLKPFKKIMKIHIIN